MASASPYKLSLIVQVLQSNSTQTNHVVRDEEGNLYFMCIKMNSKMSCLKPLTFHKLRGYQICGNKIIIDKLSSSSFMARPSSEVSKDILLEAAALLESRGGVKVKAAKSVETKEKELVTVVGTVIRKVATL